MSRRPLGRKCLLKVKLDGNTASSYSTITDVRDLTINDEAETVQVDVRPASGSQGYKPTYITGRTLTVDYSIAPRDQETTHEQLLAAYTNETVLPIKIEDQYGRAVETSVLVTKFNESQPLGDVVTFDVSMAYTDEGTNPTRTDS